LTIENWCLGVLVAEWLRRFEESLGCKIYAHCLMTNHIHLVVGPDEHVEGLALLMKRVVERQEISDNRERIGGETPRN
jgi:putative transposase